MYVIIGVCVCELDLALDRQGASDAYKDVPEGRASMGLHCHFKAFVTNVKHGNQTHLTQRRHTARHSGTGSGYGSG